MKYKLSKYNFILDRNDKEITIFNTFSGAVSKMEKPLYEMLESFSEREIDIELDPLMINHGFVIPSDFDEYEDILSHRYLSTFNKSPRELKLVLAPSLKCNYKCIYCFEGESKNPEIIEQNNWVDDVADFIIDRCNFYKSIKRIHITFFGGEPLLFYEDFISLSKKIISFTSMKDMKFTSSMVSNGFLLSKEIAIKLRNECNMRNVQITLDGLSIKYAFLKGVKESFFESVVNNIESVSDILSITVRINTNKFNQNDMKPLLHYLLCDRKLNGRITVYFAEIIDYKKMDFANFEQGKFEEFREEMIEFMIESGYSDSLSINLPVKKSTYCPSLKGENFVIGPAGKIYRCEHCLGREGQEIGDVKNGFYKKLENESFLNRPIKPRCKSCVLFPLCLGGCVADSVLDNIKFDCDTFFKKIKFDVSLAVKKKKEKLTQL